MQFTFAPLQEQDIDLLASWVKQPHVAAWWPTEAAMEKAGKTNAQFLTLKGADHFSSTLMYNHQEVFYSKLLDYLKKDCGPGGL